jgi:hypothetical protein
MVKNAGIAKRKFTAPKPNEASRALTVDAPAWAKMVEE